MSRAPRSLPSVALVAALVALAVGDAGAQGILGRVKQKAAEKAGEKLGGKGARKPDAPAAAQPAAGQPASETARNEHVLEIDAATLDRLQAAPDAEAREIGAIRPMLGRTKED